jgi:hypothetical protein
MSCLTLIYVCMEYASFTNPIRTYPPDKYCCIKKNFDYIATIYLLAFKHKNSVKF